MLLPVPASAAPATLGRKSQLLAAIPSSPHSPVWWLCSLFPSAMISFISLITWLMFVSPPSSMGIKWGGGQEPAFLVHICQHGTQRDL